ncbi:MAG: kynureninase [Fimbriimonas sp.]
MQSALDRARELDAADPLARFREEFVIEDPEVIYLDGNSLGRMPRRTLPLMQELLAQQWGSELIRSWPDSWLSLPSQLGAKIAQLIGAQDDEVLVCDSTSVNLYKLVHAALALHPGRTEILTDGANFPSDWYVLAGIAEKTSHSLRGQGGPDENTALLTLSHVTFKSGELYDMAALTKEAHAQGALTLWDLSHSVGAVPVHLIACNADLAVGCTYKYLNAGPGSSAFLYIRRDLQEQLRNPIQGWFGRDNAFDFGLDYRPRTGIDRFLTGSPNILSMAPVGPGVDLILEAGIENLRAKSLQQTDFLIELWQEHLAPLGFTLNTPTEPHRRGSHVSFGHPDALAIDLALINEANVIPDFRTPDNIRFGCTPLYTTFAELANAIARICTIMETGTYKHYCGQVPAIT